MKFIVLLVLFGIVCQVAAKTDYCSRKLCRGRRHIGCKNSGDFAKSCPAGRESVPMTSELKTAILNKHNELRSKLATGGLPDFEPCSKMATMQWNDELASLADLNVKRCEFSHDACRNTPDFPLSGQNLAIQWSSAPFSKSVEDITLHLIDSWWEEYEKASMEEIESYPGSSMSGEVIGHFTEMAIDENDRVGCALSTYRDPEVGDWYTLLLACNYARINILDRKIYTVGRTASRCKTGTNPIYEGLCSKDEKY